MDAAEFLERAGREAVDDDLERANCMKYPQAGHYSCGWCEAHDKPRWECLACLHRRYVPGQG